MRRHPLWHLITILSVFIPSAAHAQSVPTWIPRADTVFTGCTSGPNCIAATGSMVTLGREYKWLGQGGVTLQITAHPVVNVEVGKYRLWATPTLSFPVSVSAGLAVNRSNDGDDLVASILDESGGVLNVRFGPENLKVFKNYWPNNPAYGLQADLIGGIKVTDAAGFDSSGESDPDYVPVFETRANVRLVLPITPAASASYDATNLAGTLQIRLQTAFSRTGSDSYRNVFGGDPLDSSLWSTSITATGVITEVVYVEAGWIFHVSDEQLKGDSDRNARSFRFAFRVLR